MKTLFERKGYDPVSPSALERLQRGAGPKGKGLIVKSLLPPWPPRVHQMPSASP